MCDPVIVGELREAYARGYVQAGAATTSRLDLAQHLARQEFPLYKAEPKTIDGPYGREYRLNGQVLQFRDKRIGGHWYEEREYGIEFAHRLCELAKAPTNFIKTDD